MPLMTLAPARGLGFATMVMQDQVAMRTMMHAKAILLHLEKGQHVSEPDSPAIAMWDGYSEGLAVYGCYVSVRVRDLGHHNLYNWFEDARKKLRKHRRRFTKFPDMLQSDEFIQFSREWLVWEDPSTYWPLLESFVEFEPVEEPQWPT